MDSNLKIPTHVGVIMDGNGRWAKKRFMPRTYGHKAGLQRMIELTEHAKSVGVKYLTVYALSTENLSRPQEEVEGLFSLFKTYFSKNVSSLISGGSAIKVIGDLSVLPNDVRALIEDAEKSSPQSPDFTLIIALNYGGRAEIINAVNAAISLGEPVTEQTFSNLLYTKNFPYPDLIIRTGKEKRLSNFLTWQSAYSELYFSDVLFPDFTAEQFDIALADYGGRTRRFGRL